MPDHDSLFDEPAENSGPDAGGVSGAWDERAAQTGNDPSGHRARLRKRLVEGGAEALGITRS